MACAFLACLGMSWHVLAMQAPMVRLVESIELGPEVIPFESMARRHIRKTRFSVGKGTSP